MSNFFTRYAIPLILSQICIVTLLLHPHSNLWLAYDRDLVGNGEIWRLFSANLVHLGTWHTLLNLTSLWFISWIFRALLSRNDWLWWFLITFICNILAMHLWTPNIQNYVGMSGALYALIAACAVAELRLGVKISGILLVIVAVKIFAPHILGIESEYDQWLGGKVIEESHIIGFVEGLILGLLWPKSRLKKPALAKSLHIEKQQDH
ncbi:MAG: rhombosortase [Kangiellaceae bacterium]|nr:rhombosortase [Kangiellaceae bacterium]